MKKSLLIIALAIVSISFGNCGNSSPKIEKQSKTKKLSLEETSHLQFAKIKMLGKKKN